MLPGSLDPPFDGPAGVAHDWTTRLQARDTGFDIIAQGPKLQFTLPALSCNPLDLHSN